MNSLSYYIHREAADDARSDKYEATALLMQSEKAKLSMKIDGQYHEVPGLIGPITWRDDTDVRVNVYCMHAVVVPHEGSKVVDSNNFKFGDTYALIMNINEFLRRVRQAAERAGHKVSWKLIRYVDPASYHGPAGVFTKDVKFSYQSEFRIVMRPGTGEPVSLILGNLSGIIVTGELASINEKFRFVGDFTSDCADAGCSE